MKTVKRIATLLLILAVFVLGYYVAYDLYNKKFVVQTVAVESEDDVVNQKLAMETAVIEQFQSKKELITLETTLTDIVEWNDSWGAFGLFHKSQRIRFYGTGLYVTDLNQMTRSDIQIDPRHKTLTILIPKPFVKTITIDEEKTEYESVEKGWLRFGEMSLSPEQYNTVYATVKENMLSELERPTLYVQAEKSTLTQTKEIFQLIIDSLDGDYAVHLEWK